LKTSSRTHLIRLLNSKDVVVRGTEYSYQTEFTVPADDSHKMRGFMKESLQQALTDPVPIFCKSSVSFHHHQKLTDHSIRGTEHRPPYLQVCKEYGKKSTRKPEYLRSEQADSALALSSLTELTDQHAHRLTVAICSNLVNTRYQLPQYLR
jgi:hypothetical protein